MKNLCKTNSKDIRAHGSKAHRYNFCHLKLSIPRVITRWCLCHYCPGKLWHHQCWLLWHRCDATVLFRISKDLSQQFSDPLIFFRAPFMSSQFWWEKWRLWYSLRALLLLHKSSTQFLFKLMWDWQSKRKGILFFYNKFLIFLSSSLHNYPQDNNLTHLPCTCI